MFNFHDSMGAKCNFFHNEGFIFYQISQKILVQAQVISHNNETQPKMQEII